jgi:2-isopropylmalate synthase
MHKQDRILADSVYSGVPAHLFGLEQIVEIGPMSGKSNVLYWLEKHNIPCEESLVNRILDAAKQSSRMLSEEEVLAICTKPHAAI